MDMVAAGQSFSDWIGDHGVPILVILVGATAFTIAIRISVGRFRRRLEGSPDTTQTIDLRRAATLTHALSATALVVVWVMAFLFVLGQLGVNITPVLASAGVLGVALGFGAQNVVGDTLAGFFILLENQYGVGDMIELQPMGTTRVTGRVESLTLRITTVRSFDGTLHAVPNGKVAVVSNRSRGWARAIVDVPVAFDEDVARVREILSELFEELRQDASMRDWAHDGPTVLGVETLSGYAQQVRIIAETRPSKRLDVERLLRERCARRLAERGIQVPVPPGPAA
jgi:small conductance mechanosensitive channel